MILYVDGGAKRHKGSSNYILTCGIVALDNDTRVEFSYMRDKVSQAFCGDHELFAFAEAVLLANTLGLNASEVTIFTDDQFVAEAGVYLHKENYLGIKRDWVIARVDKFVKHFYSEYQHGRPSATDVFEMLIDFLYTARIQHVKGHASGLRGAIYNKRADYLAQRARTKTDKNSGFLDYETWLANGFYKYVSEDAMERIYVPFVEVSKGSRPAKL